MDYGRHEGDKIIQDFGNTFFEKAKDAASALVNKVADVSRKHGLDPRYLYWVLFATSWKSAAGSNWEALDIVTKLHMLSARSPASDRFTELPEQASQTDAAIKELAAWASKDFAQRLARTYLADAKTSARKIQRWLDSVGKGPVPDRQALTIVTNQLLARTKSHPHWWQDSLLLNRILTKLFG